MGESLGSHSLHSFAEFLQHHINSPEASSCLSSKRKSLKPLNVLKPFSLKFMAAEKSVRKGGRQRRGGTSKDLPDDLAEIYKTDPEEDYNQRKTRIQWIRRYWAVLGFVVISKKFLRTRKIMVMHSNERGEYDLRILVDRNGSVDTT